MQVNSTVRRYLPNPPIAFKQTGTPVCSAPVSLRQRGILHVLLKKTPINFAGTALLFSYQQIWKEYFSSPLLPLPCAVPVSINNLPAVKSVTVL
jgi:hypothetical protein